MPARAESARAACPACGAENESGAESCFTCGASLVRSPATISRGSLIASRYEILGCLGEGGMGVVFKAHDRVLDETVAMKTLRADAAESPEIRRRFVSEIKLARRVRHDNVCGIHEYGDEQGLRYITMEFVEGVNLRKVMRARGHLPQSEAFQIALQVTRGLQAIHEAGIIHRDLKSTNIMLDAQGVVRVMDFGLAKQSGVDTTLLGAVMGTPEYMSPEQARGQRVDFRCDLYALGVLIYEVFTGVVPFRGDTPVAVIAQHLNDPPPLEGPAAAAIPGPLVPVLRKALAKDPADRYQTIEAMLEALEQAAHLECQPFDGPSPGRPGRSARSAVPVGTLVPGAVSSTLTAEEGTFVEKTTLLEPVAPPPTAVTPPRWPWIAVGTVLVLGAVLAVARLHPPGSAGGVSPQAPEAAPARSRPNSASPAIDTPESPANEAVLTPPAEAAAPQTSAPAIPGPPSDASWGRATEPEGPPPSLAVMQPAEDSAAPIAKDEPSSEVRTPEPPAPDREPIALAATTTLAPLPGNPSPEYPPDMLEKGVEGVVVLKIVVSETGTVSDVQVLAGADPFAAAAAGAVRRWRFSPPMVDGRPTPVYFLMRVPFRLSQR
jgi:eukaryotic-like serine/threonine-protein kinase